MTKGKKNLNKEWGCTEINKILDHANIKKNKVYFAAENFATRLALKAKIDLKAFIQYNTKTIRFNPEITKNYRPINLI
jgi:hypothetical protein